MPQHEGEVVIPYEKIEKTRHAPEMWCVIRETTKQRFAVFPEELIPLENKQ